MIMMVLMMMMMIRTTIGSDDDGADLDAALVGSVVVMASHTAWLAGPSYHCLFRDDWFAGR